MDYCTMRIQIATRKDHLKHWRQLERKVKAALNTVGNNGELKTIFVRLLDEGTDVWRPVEGKQIHTDTFEIVSDNPDPEDEIWEFVAGQLVNCKEHVTPEGEAAIDPTGKREYRAIRRGRFRFVFSVRRDEHWLKLRIPTPPDLLLFFEIPKKSVKTLC